MTFEQSRARIQSWLAGLGTEPLEEYQSLELLLSFALPRKNVTPIARELLLRFGSLSQIMMASPAELTAIQDITPHAATILRLTPKIVLRSQMNAKPKTLLSSVADFAAVLKPYFDYQPMERMVVLSLDEKDRLLGVDILAEGIRSQVNAEYHSLLSLVLSRDASSVVIAHNHPCSPPTPSECDLVSVRLCNGILRQFHICLKDHLIFSDTGYHSMSEHGQLN